MAISTKTTPKDIATTTTTTTTTTKAPVVAKKAVTAKKTRPNNKGLGKKTKKPRQESYGSYIHRVLKQVHPETGISRKAMVVMDNLVKDIFERLASEAKNMQQKKQRRGTTTLGPSEIQYAVRMVFPGELSKHGVSEGCKALTKWTSHTAASSNNNNN